jgi:hypothetical protein
MPPRLVLLFAVTAALTACHRPAENAPSPPTPAPAPTTQPPPPPPVPAHPDAGAAPVAFRGEWNSVLADCGTAANESRLVIQPRHVRFFESSGPITAITVTGPHEATLKVTLSAEGETVERDYHFRLSSDGATLTDTAVAFDRRRCPA